MNEKVVYIKNMVCPRCIEVVKNIYSELNIPIKEIQLGNVQSSSKINNSLKSKLCVKLIAKGFEILQDNTSILIEQIKTLIIKRIHYSKELETAKFSAYLSEKLNQEYTSLSRLFSSIEGITIERFIVKQKIERIKELVFYNKYTFSEIAFQMQYSSVAHLSSQFKKETGISPSEFKKLKNPAHQALDSL